MEEPATKKRKSSHAKQKQQPPPDASMTITNPQSFRRVLGILKGIISKAHFHVEKTPDFEGISLFSIDSAFVCAIDMKFGCSVPVFGAAENMSFCVNTAIFHDFVAEVDPKAILVLEKRDNKLKMLGQDDSGNEQSFTIALIEGEYQKPCLKNIMSLIEVHLNCKKLKSFIKLVNSIKATDVTFQVLSVGKKLAFVASAQGDEQATVQIKFQSHTTEDDEETGEFAIQLKDQDVEMDNADEAHEEEEKEKTKELYREDFSVDYLNSLTKPMDQKDVCISMCPDQPLRLKVPLGDKSYLTAILSAKISDDYDDDWKKTQRSKAQTTLKK